MALNQNNFLNTENHSNEISFKDLVIQIKEWIKYLKLKFKIIIIVSLIGALIGITYSILEKPNYKATLTFAMEEDKGGSGGGGLSGALGLASSFGIDLGGGGGGAFAAANLTELMKSRLIVEKVLLKPINYNKRTISLVDYYIDKNDLRKKWTNNPNIVNINFPPNIDREKFTLQQDSLLYQIFKYLVKKENLFIQQKDKKISILTIEVNSADEFFSKFFCENLAQETSNFYIESKSKKARLNVDVLQRQADSVRSELNRAITGVASEADNVYNLNPAYNIKGAPSKKRQIDVQANQAVLTQLVVQLELAKITLRKETPLIQQIDKPIFPLEKEKNSMIKLGLIFGFLSAFMTILYLIIYKVFNQLT